MSEKVPCCCGWQDIRTWRYCQLHAPEKTDALTEARATIKRLERELSEAQEAIDRDDGSELSPADVMDAIRALADAWPAAAELEEQMHAQDAARAAGLGEEGRCAVMETCVKGSDSIGVEVEEPCNHPLPCPEHGGGE